MNKRFTKLLFILLYLVQDINGAHVLNPSLFTPVTRSINITLTLTDIKEIKIRDLQKKMGRKFSIKEKIILAVLKKKINRMDKKSWNSEADPNKQATISFVSGVLALSILTLGLLNVFIGLGIVILFAVLAFLAFWTGMKSRKSGRNFKNTFGFITGGLILFAGIIGGALILIFGVI